MIHGLPVFQDCQQDRPGSNRAYAAGTERTRLAMVQSHDLWQSCDPATASWSTHGVP
jgi:hypothetical protein